MWPSTTCPFSSLTRKVALGRFSRTSPCIWITSSLAIAPAVSFASLPRHPGSEALEVRLLQQALVLMRHQVGLHLRHEVHSDDYHDQQRRAAEVERHREAQ